MATAIRHEHLAGLHIGTKQGGVAGRGVFGKVWVQEGKVCRRSEALPAESRAVQEAIVCAAAAQARCRAVARCPDQEEHRAIKEVRLLAGVVIRSPGLGSRLCSQGSQG
eukprot:1161734-Pelagomonas_calceolata.AAC.2